MNMISKKTPMRFLTALLTAALIFTAVPGTAFAEDERPEVDGQTVEYTADPEEISEQISEHWDADAYDEDGSEYQLKRIIVASDGDIEDSFGAEDAICNTGTGEYVLEYATEEDTRQAYESLSEEYGEENVFADEIVTIDSSAGAAAGYDTVSWGTDLMRLNRLKYSAEHNPRLKNRAVVAVLDTGVNRYHTMFRGRTFHSYSRSFLNYSYSWSDDNGHGSHVAGIIADGTSRHVSLMILKVMDYNGQGSLYNVLQAIDYASKHGADVINLSLGLKDFPKGTSAYKTSEKMLKKARARGSMIVVSAGNIDPGYSSNISTARCYPANSSYVVTVSAINEGKRKADFSMHGSAVDFCAPGAGIMSAWYQGQYQYAIVDGTSMAAPGIAAAAAMVYLYHPGYSYIQAYRVLREQAVDLGARGKDSYYGYGYVHLATPAETTIKLRVPATQIRKLKKGSKKFKVTWAKRTGISGYQIRYSKKASMKGAKYKNVGKKKAYQTIRKLSRKKTYYVQVRCYKKANGYVYYGVWSPKKKVKTK